MYNKNTTRLRTALLFVFISVLFSCQKDRDIDPEPEFLVGYELLTVFTNARILELLAETGEFPPILSVILREIVTYDVSVFKIIYNTRDVNDNHILASGALVVPTASVSLPVMSFQHGTLTSEQDAPSHFTSDAYIASVVYSSAGYIIAIPDYLGYGISNHIDHPYEHGSSLATASRDMLRAVAEMEQINDMFRSNDKLFLTGYSEGGYATMALLKLLEEKHRDEFRVTAATVGAGAYNKSAFASHILESDEELTYLNSFLWVLDTYNRVYGLDRPYDFYFTEPASSVIQEGGVFANTEMNPGYLFSSEFREGILQGSDTEFLNVLADNDNYDWKPATPLQLYHGTDDDYVYYFNSLSAYQAMKERGSSVTLVTIDGGDHVTSVSDYLIGTWLFFNQYRN
jgi:fermentation-respiration switch protein FrsA (DUF1100 family)